MNISTGKPAIENSDRGFTIDKRLGWSVIVVFASGIASIVGMLLALNTTLTRLDGRQTTNATINQQLVSIERTSKATADAVQALRADMAQFFLPHSSP